jgi:predicted transposase YbfD/YdcC
MPIVARASGHAGARTLAVVENTREEIKKARKSQCAEYYLSSLGPDEITPEGMLRLIRGHWSAVEINTHWRRDVVMGEDKTRSRNVTLIANLALLRNVLLAVYAQDYGGRNMVEFKEAVQRTPSLALRLLRSR